MRFIATFAILACFWLLMSGKFDIFHLTLGFLCCLLVAALSHDLLFEKRKERRRLSHGVRFLGYLPWLVYQVLLANLHVAYLALHPRMGALIDPQVVRLKPRLRKDLAKVVFANSITLTPGTITIRIEGDDFLVHAIDATAAGDLSREEPRPEMERRIARVFDDGGAR